MIEKSTPFWEAIRSAIRLCSLTYVFVNRFSSNLEYILVLISTLPKNQADGDK